MLLMGLDGMKYGSYNNNNNRSIFKYTSYFFFDKLLKFWPLYFKVLVINLFYRLLALFLQYVIVCCNLGLTHYVITTRQAE